METASPEPPPASNSNPARANSQGQVNLQRNLASPRALFSFLMTALTILATVLALLPLVSVVLMLLYRGGSAISWALFVELPPQAGKLGGGIGNAILGTLIVVGIASLISVPLGILAAVYLSEFGAAGRAASRHPLWGQGADRPALDPGRRLRLRRDGRADRRSFRPGRRSGPGLAHVADRHADRGRGHPHVPQQDA